MRAKRCFICKKVKPTTLVLMNGSAGYRRYPLCATCAALKTNTRNVPK
jgi:hypothetical protein